MLHPEAGDSIPGTGGLRKLRFADKRRGKEQTRRTANNLLLVGDRIAVLAVHCLRQGRDVGPNAASTQGAQKNDQEGT